MRGRLIYLLPNLVTTAALSCGFYAILAGSDARFHLSAILIFIAMLFDMFDGRIARLTGTESDFGVQYDSLSDLISFGVAPALVMYQWSLHQITKIPIIPSRFGWMAAFIYVSGTTLRLARFNIQTSKIDKTYFIGLPSPAAAGMIASFVWVGLSYEWSPKNVALIGSILLILCGLAMISNIRYISGKNLKIEGRVPFPVAVFPVIALALIFLNPAVMLLLLFSIYILHGPFWLIWRIYRRKQRQS